MVKTILALFLSSTITLLSGTQTINESFSLRGLPDNAWVLDFDKNGKYQYYHWNAWGGTEVLGQGKYDLKNGLLTLISIESSSYYSSPYQPRKTPPKPAPTVSTTTETDSSTACTMNAQTYQTTDVLYVEMELVSQMLF